MAAMIVRWHENVPGHSGVVANCRQRPLSSVENQSRETTSRVEFSGPEQLDRVLIHLREVRERGTLKERLARSRAARGGLPPEENLAFDRAPPVSETPAAAPTQTGSGEPAATSAGEVRQATAPHDPAVAQPADSTQPERPSIAAAPGTATARPSAPREPALRQPRVQSPLLPGSEPTAQSAPVAKGVPVAPTPPAASTAPAAPTSPEPTLAAPGAPAAASKDPALAAMARATDRLTRAIGGGEAAPPPPIAAPKPAPRASASKSAGAQLGKGELLRSVLASMPAFKAIAWFSFASNILMLAGPLFMLQVYDRVMTSGSMPTLVALSVLTAAIYGVIGLLEMVRSRVIVRIGVELDQRMSERVFAAALRRSLAAPGSSMQALRELDQLRQFISGPGPLTFFDAPWTPVYLLVIYLTHWTLGVAATLGAILLLVIAWASEARSRQPLTEAGKASQRSLELAESGQRNAEAITAMGMLGAYRARWQTANRDALAWQVLASDRLSGLSSLSKSLRLLLQSMMLAIGAALAINGMISSGAIIAATIIFGRALAPVEQAVAQWRGFGKAREAFTKIEELLKAHPETAQKMSLPAPKGRLETRALKVAAPDGRSVILANISFVVEPGQMVAVIGPSASGKSTLVRALVGLWPAAGGEVLLDGARLDQWNGEELGRHIGYLPQSVELFAGTVRENISRFDPAATDADVIDAARAAHAHDMIMALPKGYETELGAFGAYLSAGQRQRIGLARALYGDPALVVLDEPNANLDRTGDEALAAAIDGMRARGHAVVLVSHRVQAIGKADLLLYLERGQQRAFGPREEVLRFLQQGGQGQPAQGAARGNGQGPQTAGGNGKR